MAVSRWRSEVNRLAAAAIAVAALAFVGFSFSVGYQHGRAGDEAWLDNLLDVTSRPRIS